MQQLQEEMQEHLRQQNADGVQGVLADLEPSEIASLIEALERDEGDAVFRQLPREEATSVFKSLPHANQLAVVEDLSPDRELLANLLNDLSPDDRTAFFEELPDTILQRLLVILEPKERRNAIQLLGYPEDSVGRLATTDYIALRPDWTVGQALRHVRRFGRDSETINVIYIVDKDWLLLDDVRLREVLLADPEAEISSLMDNRFVALTASDDQEKATTVFREHNRAALPVVNPRGVLVGIVTIDDVLSVAEEEATEDMHKVGGVEALDLPYMHTPLGTLIKKRGRWLAVLFIGEMFTASAMGYFESEIARAVVLALFVPLVISSGGNTGSQAATLIVRAMAVGEVRLRDWWRVFRRELVAGLVLGLILGMIGFLRVTIWANAFDMYGQHWILLATTVSLALVGVVTWGAVVGAMLPLLIKRLGADPAVSSAPFIATLVDVTGLIIYFSVALLILSGTLL